MRYHHKIGSPCNTLQFTVLVKLDLSSLACLDWVCINMNLFIGIYIQCVLMFLMPKVAFCVLSLDLLLEGRILDGSVFQLWRNLNKDILQDTSYTRLLSKQKYMRHFLAF